MSNETAQPFATIESALAFMDLLAAAIDDTHADVLEDVATAQSSGEQRQVEALQLVNYKLEQLSIHVAKSERLLKDLARLRALIMDEQKSGSREAATVAAP